MDLEQNANPVGTGSGVRDAAKAIMDGGLLEPAGEGPAEPTEKQPQEESQDTPQAGTETPEAAREPSPEAKPEEGQPEVGEGESKSPDESAEADAEAAEELELPDTVTGLSEALGLEGDALMDLKVPVTVNGKTEEVTLRDAVKGHQLEADYRQKTTALSEQRKELDQAVAHAQQEWQQRFERIDALAQDLEQALSEDGQNLDQILASEGAEAYLAAKAKVDTKKEKLEQARQAREEQQRQWETRNQEAAQRYYAEQQQRLVEAIPDFGKPEKAEQLQKDMRGYLQNVGFTPDEIRGVVDARMVQVIHDAMRFQNVQKSTSDTKKKLKVLPKVVKPGKAEEKGEGKARKQGALIQRLQKSGGRQEAAKIFEELL